MTILQILSAAILIVAMGVATACTQTTDTATADKMSRDVADAKAAAEAAAKAAQQAADSAKQAAQAR